MLRVMTILQVLLISALSSLGQIPSVSTRSLPLLLDSLQTNSYLPFINEKVVFASLLKQLYGTIENEFLWNDDYLIKSAIAEIENASNHGLLSNDYHLKAIEQIKLIPNLTEDQIDLFRELMLTDGLILYYYHLRNGKLDPINNTVHVPNEDQELKELLECNDLISGAVLLECIRNNHPSSELYMRLFGKRAGLRVNTQAATDLKHIEQIKTIDVNLERLRWTQKHDDRKIIIVNVADFSLSFLVDENVMWESKVIVGNCNTPTPLILSRVEQIIFNPSWIVPMSIIEESILANIKQDPDYLTRNGFNLIALNGALISPDEINWQTATIDSINFQLVQAPGPANALGRVKFVFPNDEAIYVHDTPNKRYFSKKIRTFSHGCIRLEDPLILAELLLNDTEQYNINSIKEIVDSGIITKIDLQDPCQILIFYLTLTLDDKGKIIYLDDVYDLDDLVFQRLKTPFQQVLRTSRIH